MASSYEDAVAQLMQVPHEAFVAERKRLATELKASGDKAAAARLARLGRPPLSAWVVNQLWWQARPEFEKLVDLAARVRGGERAAQSAHRDSMAGLRARSAELLQAGGHPATEATLRRVAMTLGAVAAAGGFDPDLPGALTADRDPPGFEAFGFADGSDTEGEGLTEAAPRARAVRAVAESTPAKPRATATHAAQEEAQRERAEQAEREQAERERAERHRLEKQRAEHHAQQRKLEAELQAAESELDSQQREVAKRRGQLSAAEESLEQARAAVARARERLEALAERTRTG